MIGTAYVTGATGCIGRNLVDVLLENDWRVIVLHRKSSDLNKLNGCDVECREVELTDFKSVKTALCTKADAMFHVAANLSHNKIHNTKQFIDNVWGTDNLVSASTNINKFIFTSTGAAYYCDNMSIEEIYNVKQTYIKTKKMSEFIVSRINAIILRLPIVVGKYDYNNYSQILRMIESRKLKFSIPGTMMFAQATRVAKAHLSAYKNGKVGTYFLAGEVASWHEFCVRVANLMNIDAPYKPLPNWIYHVYAYVLYLKQIITGKPELFTPELVNLICQKADEIDLSVDILKTRNDLGYQPGKLDDALLECYEWMKEGGYSNMK